jgi:tRNA nucleotidyltransferase/poly(A) polymerase
LNGEYVDPFLGQADLKARLLRAVDAQTFAEDPLRALRAAQFAGRFAFEIHPDLERLCQEMPLHELPAERIQGEVDKLLLKARQPRSPKPLTTKTKQASLTSSLSAWTPSALTEPAQADPPTPPT